jgi:pimeloyl-ACP methyl ester carboxylesterase
MTTTTNPVQSTYRSIDGVRIRYADSGGSDRPTILLTSPWPESLHAFDLIWPTLEPQARLLAVDLPGFGRSERRDDLLSPRAMGRFLARLVDEAGLDHPYVMGPDVGTAAALFAAADYPDRFAGLVVGGGATAVPLQLGEPLTSWVLDPDLAPYRRLDPHAVVNTAVDNHARHVPDDIRADYLASYEGDRFVESMRYVRRYPEELPVLHELLPHLRVPVTVVSGMRDRVVPLANATYVADRVPEGRSVVLDAGHFLWEEVPDQYAEAVLDAVLTTHHQN